MRRSYVGKENPHWRGGKFKNSITGYVMQYAPDHPRANNGGYVFQHILIMEKKLGRFLSIGKELVHHRNGNRSDNRMVNLELMTLKEHAIEHLKERNFNRDASRKAQIKRWREWRKIHKKKIGRKYQKSKQLNVTITK